MDTTEEWKKAVKVMEAENVCGRFHYPIRKNIRLQGFHTYYFRRKTNFL